MRWTHFQERVKENMTQQGQYYCDPSFVKELIEDYTDGDMELYELYHCLSIIHATSDNLVDYFNSVQLNSFDKNILRYLSELNDESRLDYKYFNYSDKGYLYRNKPFILLPIVKQELADMLIAAESEKTCLDFFTKHKYDINRAKLEGFSNGDWQEDINMFINGWKETIKYLTYLVETTKSIIRYFEEDLCENPIAIRQFFYDYSYTFDIFLLVVVYETYIKYHYLDDAIANEISNHYKTLKPIMHEKIAMNSTYSNDFDEKINNPQSEPTKEYVEPEVIFDDDIIVDAETHEDVVVEEIVEEEDEEPTIFSEGLKYLKRMFSDDFDTTTETIEPEIIFEEEHIEEVAEEEIIEEEEAIEEPTIFSEGLDFLKHLFD